MTEPKKGPVEKRADARSAAHEKRAAEGLHQSLKEFAHQIERSNAGMVQVLENSLAFLQRVLKDDQKNRRFWRWVLICGMVLNFGLLGALGYNAIEGAKARTRLIANDTTQQETLEILKGATGPEAQAKAAAGLLEAFKQIDCNNQRAIQRAMHNLNAPYELTPECR